MLIPVVLIPVFTLAFFFLTWQGGLMMSIEKAMLPVLFGLLVVVSFLVISIVVIVRLCRKMPVSLLLQVLGMEIIALSAFFILDYKKNTWILNQYLYQHRREAFVQRIQASPNAGNEAAIMDSIHAHRNRPFSIELNGSEFNLQNKKTIDYQTKETKSIVTVQRDCDGNLTAEFVYDGEFMDSDYAILYSDKLPRTDIITIWDANALPRKETSAHIDDYAVLDTISPHWYYVRCKSPWAAMFNFNLFGNFGAGGSAVSGAGGCQ
jgi:hypothetical protein